MICKYLCLLLYFTALLPPAAAQNTRQLQPAPAAAATAGKDSLLQTRQQFGQTLTERALLLRLEDSIRRESLRKELQGLRAGEQQKVAELQNQLRMLQVQDSLRQAGIRRQVDSLKAVTTGVPVAPFGDTLFLVYTRYGPLSPSERAENISRKLRTITGSRTFYPDSLRLFHNEQNTELHYGDLTILSVTDRDAFWLGQPQQQIAETYRTRISQAIAAEIQKTSLRTILTEIGLAVLALVVLVLILKGIGKIFGLLRLRIMRQRSSFFRGIRINNYELLDAGRQVRVALVVLQVLKVLIIVLTLYLALPVLFSIFPWTEGLADTLFGYVLSPLRMILRGLLNYIPNLITIVVIMVITRYLIRFIGFLATEVEKGALQIQGFYPDWARPTANILKFLVLVFMFITVFPYLPGSDSPVFQGVTVLLGLLISLGSSTAIANIVAGLVITYMRPFRLGERVKIGDNTGDVIEKNLLITRLRTTKNEVITVPNSNILSSASINYSTSSEELGLILYTTVTIGYDVPWRQVHELLKGAAMATEGILQHREPFVLQTSLDDFYVSYQLNAYTNQPNGMARIYSELHQHIQDHFNRAGVEIMSPHYRAHRDGPSTIPE